MTGPENIPYFIQIRGCINCSASKNMKEKHGTDYGFDHEIIASCLILGCQEWSHNLSKPFIDPEEIVRFVEKSPSPKFVDNAKVILQNYQEIFGEYYKQIGVNIEDLIQRLDQHGK